MAQPRRRDAARTVERAAAADAEAVCAAQLRRAGRVPRVDRARRARARDRAGDREPDRRLLAAPKPLKVEPLAPPPPGEGVQLRAPQQLLPPLRSARPASSVTTTSRAGFPPSRSALTTSTFRYKRIEARQDPLSHHAVVIVYTGKTRNRRSRLGPLRLSRRRARRRVLRSARPRGLRRRRHLRQRAARRPRLHRLRPRRRRHRRRRHQPVQHHGVEGRRAGRGVRRSAA